MSDLSTDVAGQVIDPAQNQQAGSQEQQQQTQNPPAAEQLAKLQEEFKAEREARQKTEGNYKELQAEFTRRNQAAAQALQGTQQQTQDPLAIFVDKLVKKGYDPKQARDLAEIQYEMIRPIAEQLHQNNASMNARYAVDGVMNEVVNKAGRLFEDEEVQRLTHEAVTQFAVETGKVPTAEFALNIAKQHYVDRVVLVNSQNQQTQPSQQFRTQTPGLGNFTPRQAQKQSAAALNPEQQRIADEMLKFSKA